MAPSTETSHIPCKRTHDAAFQSEIKPASDVPGRKPDPTLTCLPEEIKLKICHCLQQMKQQGTLANLCLMKPYRAAATEVLYSEPNPAGRGGLAFIRTILEVSELAMLVRGIPLDTTSSYRIGDVTEVFENFCNWSCILGEEPYIQWGAEDRRWAFPSTRIYKSFQLATALFLHLPNLRSIQSAGNLWRASSVLEFIVQQNNGFPSCCSRRLAITPPLNPTQPWRFQGHLKLSHIVLEESLWMSLEHPRPLREPNRILGFPHLRSLTYSSRHSKEGKFGYDAPRHLPNLWVPNLTNLVLVDSLIMIPSIFIFLADKSGLQRFVMSRIRLIWGDEQSCTVRFDLLKVSLLRHAKTLAHLVILDSNVNHESATWRPMESLIEFKELRTLHVDGVVLQGKDGPCVPVEQLIPSGITSLMINDPSRILYEGIIQRKGLIWSLLYQPSQLPNLREVWIEFARAFRISATIGGTLRRAVAQFRGFLSGIVGVSDEACPANHFTARFSLDDPAAEVDREYGGMWVPWNPRVVAALALLRGIKLHNISDTSSVSEATRFVGESGLENDRVVEDGAGSREWQV